jgi:hypothetical protein
LRSFRIEFRERADLRTSSSEEAGAMNADMAIFIVLEAYAVVTPLVLLALIVRLSSPGWADERESRA